jgi:hypothetical protein
MGEHEESRGISRRQLLTRLGAGTAVAWLTPIATSLGSRADALCVCEGDACDWVCGGNLQQCGTCGPLGAAYCSHDVDGNCFCWENSFCSEVTDCTQNSDCPSGYACVPDTCCGTPKCLAGCGLGKRPRVRRGKTASGRIIR